LEFPIPKSEKYETPTQEGIEGIEVDEDTCYRLANTLSQIIKEVGTVNEEKAQELLDSVEDNNKKISI